MQCFHIKVRSCYPFSAAFSNQSSISGSGAGHSIEDANVLGLAIRDFLANPTAKLSTYTSLYQSVRLPRAQKAQITSRQAGDVYEMQGPDFEGLSFEECLPIVREKLKDRMAWVWSGHVDRDYLTVKIRLGIG